MKAILSKLNLYQKGLIIGFFIPIVCWILITLGPLLFRLAHLDYCPAGSSLMFVGIFLYPGPISSFLVWSLIGFFSGIVLHISKGKGLIFRLIKWILGSTLLLPGVILLFFIIRESWGIIFISIKNIPYILLIFILPLLLISLGYYIIRLKD